MALPLIAGNWKMNGLAAESGRRVLELRVRQGAGGLDHVELAVFPPHPLLPLIARALDGSRIALGAQDCHEKTSGAHTGDVSAELLADVGCSYVILGHSERRQDHGEDDAMVKAKAGAAVAAGLVPVVCLGETEAERDAGRALAVVERQLAGALPERVAPEKLAIAYEPVWA
ncbi:MAG: triose-phosphate isomerase family protein, partial [Kiloniellales bacterium]